MESLALILHQVGLLLYAGPLLAFAVLLPLASRLEQLEPWQLDRAWRAWAPLSGLALGSLILGGLLRYYLLHDGFSWGGERAVDQIFLAKHLIFLVLWIEYTYTEIWVAEPVRQLDTGLEPPGDLAAYAIARARLIRHLWVGAACVLAILVLSSLPY
jgi:putative copper export protein